MTTFPKTGDIRRDIVVSMEPDRRAQAFAQALLSDGPSPVLGERASDLAWLVGSWTAIVRDYSEDGSVSESEGEWWFSWILEGRALQDVWIVPPRYKRSGATTEYNRYGTTIRFLDSSGDGWRITWINAVTGKINELAGRRDGTRIVLEGSDNGARIRWSFNEITEESFIWRGEHRLSNDTWVLGAEFFLSRMREDE